MKRPKIDKRIITPGAMADYAKREASWSGMLMNVGDLSVGNYKKIVPEAPEVDTEAKDKEDSLTTQIEALTAELDAAKVWKAPRLGRDINQPDRFPEPDRKADARHRRAAGADRKIRIVGVGTR